MPTLKSIRNSIKKSFNTIDMTPVPQDVNKTNEAQLKNYNAMEINRAYLRELSAAIMTGKEVDPTIETAFEESQRPVKKVKTSYKETPIDFTGALESYKGES